MEIFLRVGLGIVLAGAALAKLASPRASIGAMASFGFGDGPFAPDRLGGADRDRARTGGRGRAGLGPRRLSRVRPDAPVRRAHGRRSAARPGGRALRLLRSSLEGFLARGAPQPRAGGRVRADPVAPTRSRSTAWLAGIGVGVALLACAALTVAVLALAREVGMLRLQLGTQGALEIAGEGPEIGSRAPALAARDRPERRGASAWRSSAPRAAPSARRSRRRSRTSRTTPMSRSASSTRSRRPSSGATSASRAARSRSRPIARAPCWPRGPSTTSPSWRASWRRRRGASGRPMPEHLRPHHRLARPRHLAARLPRPGRRRAGGADGGAHRRHADRAGRRPRPSTSAATPSRPAPARIRPACRGSTPAASRCAPATGIRSTTSAGR